MDIDEIVDRESLETWLQGQPREISVRVAHRVAMRVLPLFLEVTNGHTESDLTALLVLRSNLISGVAWVIPSSELKKAAANAAASAAHNAYSAYATYIAGYAADDATAAAYAAAYAAADEKSAIAAADAALAAVRAEAAKTKLWIETQQDCRVLDEDTAPDIWPLWQAERNPFAEKWEVAKNGLGDDWAFWRDWYQDALDGVVPDWEMLEEIALIKPEVWEQGPEVVNARIADIQLKYAVKKTPNAEVMSVNADTRKLRVDVMSDMPKDHLQDAVEKLENVLSLFNFETGAGNQFIPIKSEWQIIGEATQKYGTRPRMLHSACVRVLGRLDIKFENGDCPTPDKDADIHDFYDTVKKVSVDLFNRDPQVKEAFTSTVAARLPELDDEMMNTLLMAADEMAERAEGELHDETPEIARRIVDGSVSVEERKEAFYITASRLLRAGVLMGYTRGKAGLVEIESVTKTIAGISTNVAIIGGTVSAPLWIGKAVEILRGLF